MDGDIAPIEALRELAGRYSAMTDFDEVHAVGVYGQQAAASTQVLQSANEILKQTTVPKGKIEQFLKDLNIA